MAGSANGMLAASAWVAPCKGRLRWIGATGFGLRLPTYSHVPAERMQVRRKNFCAKMAGAAYAAAGLQCSSNVAPEAEAIVVCRLPRRPCR
jgi:hypothetical protein